MAEQKPPEPQDNRLRLSDAHPAETSDPGRHQADATAHLANERTFLAWSFTSLFIMSGGVALARTLIALNSLNTSPILARTLNLASVVLYPTTMGLIFLGAGLAIMILAAMRFLSVQVQIIEGRYRPSGVSVMIYLAIVLGLAAVVALFLMQLRGEV